MENVENVGVEAGGDRGRGHRAMAAPAPEDGMRWEGGLRWQGTVVPTIM